MLRKLGAAALALGAVGAAGFWVLTTPQQLQAADLPDHQPDIVNGERIFHAGGCSSCHAAPGSKGEDKLKLAGGLELATPFGTFRSPNISPDETTGIGGWSALDLVNAMQRGTSPDGRHYYPAFPYTSYARMKTEDIIDLKAYLDTLPAVSNEVGPHLLGFPFNVRRGLGLWKTLYLDPAPVASLPADVTEAARRGQYLVEGPGHCGECHTPRNPIGGPDKANWLAGAANPEGKGSIPNITPHQEGIASWTAEDIVNALETGFKPDYDSFGGSMVAVQENMAALPAEDRAAIAAYLKAVPAHPSTAPKNAEGGS
ncbi:c-type cytochrome [Chthonobacter albigriseus]|uniref:c-type cytochrome n=1 Tax=Chthonobacter albigriseus TaxID=1683161 RepID=UPI0015EF886C|nr:cytochrome c [Chthonobacter albigriseus]